MPDTSSIQPTGIPDSAPDKKIKQQRQKTPQSQQIISSKKSAKSKTSSGSQAIPLKKENKYGEIIPDIGMPEPQPTNFLQDLPYNPDQKNAIMHNGLPLLVIAGPGTGKTRVLTYRIAQAIAEHRVLPEQVLAITFTNKAAQEMQQRLQGLLANDSESITVTTFHKLGWKIIKKHHELLGLSKDILILDNGQKEYFIQKINPNLSKFLDNIVSRKNSGEIYDKKTSPAEEQAFLEYQKILTEHNMVDFEDLIFLPISLFQTHPEILENYQSLYRMITVDEYQDINPAQYQFLHLLYNSNTDFMAIGDPDQAIYSFRGADVKYFMQFSQDFIRSKTIKLGINYRSTIPITQAANGIIRHNPTHQPNPLQALKTGEKIQYYQAKTGKSEAEFVVKTIDQLIGGISNFSIVTERSNGISQGNYDFSSFAILYRTHAQLTDLEESLARSGIPYQIVRNEPFWQQPKLCIFKSLLQVLIYPDQDVLLSQILLELPGIGIQTLETLKKHHEKKKISLWRMLEQDMPDISKNIFSVIETLKKSLKFLQDESQKTISTRDFLMNLLNHIHQTSIFNSFKLDSIQEEILLNFSQDFSKLKDFLIDIQLHHQNDEYNQKARKVTLMTLHASKGLEFPVVFIVGCEENILPASNSKTLTEFEEERRLFYVGVTRAKDYLYLSCAEKRLLNGEIQNNAPSRYIQEIPVEYITKIISKTKVTAKEKNIEQINLF